MSNADGNVVGAEAQLAWFLWRAFTKLVDDLPPDFPADFVPVLVATPEVEDDSEIADTVQLDLVAAIGAYKLWLINDWLAYAANPTDGSEDVIPGAWRAIVQEARTPLIWEEIIQSWGTPDEDEGFYPWVAPPNLYLLTVSSPWSKFAGSDAQDFALTVIQASDGASLAERWATAFNEVGVDHALFQLGTQEDIIPGDSQPAYMNYPVWKEIKA